jgi:hypothetical protein
VSAYYLHLITVRCLLVLAEGDGGETSEDQEMSIQPEDVTTHLVTKQPYHLTMVADGQVNMHPEVCSMCQSRYISPLNACG